MSGQGPSVQTGFLFGNINKQGRLEEDYLSDEAKDNLEHIGNKVTEKYHELTEIRESISTKKSVLNDDDVDYDDERSQPNASQVQPSSAEDFYEDDVGLDQELDEEDRKKLAERALKVASSGNEDDEGDYDEDDDDGGAIGDAKRSKKPVATDQRGHVVTVSASLAVSVSQQPHDHLVSAQAQIVRLDGKKDTSSPSALVSTPPYTTVPGTAPPLPTLGPTGPATGTDPLSQSAPVTPPRTHSEADSLEHQRRLFQQPTFPILTQSPPKASRDPDKDDDPILFSELFARTPTPLNFRRPRRSLGVIPGSIPPPPACCDDGDLLNRPPSPPIIDPVAVALDRDAHSRKVLFPPAPEIRPRTLHVSDDEEEGEPDVSLYADVERDPPSSKPSFSNTPAPFEIMKWEKAVDWGNSTQSDVDDDDWYTMDPHGADSPRIDKNVEMGDGGAKNSSEADSGSEDDAEFEDPVEFNPQLPSASQEAPLKSQEPASSDMRDGDGDEDDDDEMEWEDGNISTTSPQVPTVTDSTAAAQSHAQPSEKVTAASKKGSGSKGIASELQNCKSDASVEVAPLKVSSTANRTDVIKKPDKGSTDAPLPLQSNSVPEDSDEGHDIINAVFQPNKELADGLWVHGIVWNSESDSDSHDTVVDSFPVSKRSVLDRLSSLVLDMNDPNMVFERITDEVGNDEEEQNSTASPSGLLSGDKTKALFNSSGPQLHQHLQGDVLNVSNDVFYVTGAAQHLKLDRGSILRGLQNAQPAKKIQTTPSALSDAELLSFHRPKLTSDNLIKNAAVQAVRRKRVKGGNAHIAGQIPKKKSELRCSEKDAYRVSVFEYALERQPCILPIPGMASRLCTYARKESAEAVQRAVNAAAGTAQADTIFMAPDEPPPLAAGNIEVDDKPLSVVESHVYAAPAAKKDIQPSDFLLVRHGKSVIIREIDSLISIGVTEPKVEVMTPNTEKYKKYSRERMVLWVMREFQRMTKEIEKRKGKDKDSDGKGIRDPPYIEKEEIYSEFPRRRTYPETGLLRALKEMSRFQNGKYFQDEQVKQKYNAREQELLRIITPTDTASFESMESAWEQILDRGILNFTHPSGQGNILAAAEADRSGLEAGPAVGKYIKSHLLKTPWYRSANIISAHRLQRRDLLQALSLARIVNDLKEGGEVMEAKLLTLTPAEMNNVLTQVYRFNSKKVPATADEKRSLVREVCQKRGKGAPSPEVSDYPTIIRTVLKKHRDAGLSKGAAIAAQGTSMADGTFLGLPLQIQRQALEDGVVQGLPAEEDDFVPGENADKLLAAYYSSGGGKRSDAGESTARRIVKKGRPPSVNAESKGIEVVDAEIAITTGPVKNIKSSGADNRENSELPESVGGGNDKRRGEEVKKPIKKKAVRLRVVRKVLNEKGELQPVVTFVSDPKEVERILAKKNAAKANNSTPQKKSSDGLKISIDLKRLQGGKADMMKKKNVAGIEKSKGKAKGKKKQSEIPEDLTVVKKVNEKKGQIGKIKINTKQLKSDQEGAALKRKRSQYSDDLDYRTKKVQKTSRKKRNGTVELNGILEQIEDTVRKTEGYVVPNTDVLTISRLKDGESPPPGTRANKLANPEGLGLDFTAPVDTKLVPAYKQIIKKPMYLNLIRTNCKNMKYQRAGEFLDDMLLMVNNARAFNKTPDVQWVVQHAELLLKVAEEQVAIRAEEIQTAENMVALERSDANAYGGGPTAAKPPKGVKGKTSKGKGPSAGKKVSDKKRKKGKPSDGEPIAIPDDESVKEVSPIPVYDLSTGDDYENRMDVVDMGTNEGHHAQPLHTRGGNGVSGPFKGVDDGRWRPGS